ncbi:DUF819 family protein [Woodsholea maritima]|uniref:DUF819 family protein n=1 Tax=Woodsholea maritima TaxID=240237 RepID=UPI000368CF80|nr:DUF819 family protein [Woodsholea maritima]
MFETPLIAADNHLAILASLFGIAAFGFLMEKTRLGAVLTGTVWTILAAIILANIGILPFGAPGYDFVFKYFVPVLIPLFLIKADLRKIFFETGRLTLAFAFASIATVIGALIAVLIVPLGDQEAGIAGALTASYVGGSVNFAALLDMTGLGRDHPELVGAMVASDNLASAIFLALLAVSTGFTWLTRLFVARDHSQESTEALTQTSERTASAFGLGVSLFFALGVVAVSDVIVSQGSALLGHDLGAFRYMIITVLALIPATAFPKTMARLDGGFELGVALSFVFFAAIAAGADIGAMIIAAPMIMVFILILLTLHGIVGFGLAKVFKLSLPEIITASNAAVLGATTAPALAAAKGWRDLVTPGVLVGVLGYVVGTFLGGVVYWLLSNGFWPT